MTIEVHAGAYHTDEESDVENPRDIENGLSYINPAAASKMTSSTFVVMFSVIFTVAIISIHQISDINNHHPCDRIVFQCNAMKSDTACIITPLANAIPQLPQVSYRLSITDPLCDGIVENIMVPTICYLRFTDDRPTVHCDTSSSSLMLWLIIAIGVSPILFAAIVMICVLPIIGASS